MIQAKYIECFEKTLRDDRNLVSKKNLSSFIEKNYFNATVEEVNTGTAITRYDIKVQPKAIKYFLKLLREFNAFFDTNDCRLFQNGKLVCLEVPNKYVGTYRFSDCIASLQTITNHTGKLYVSIGESLNCKNIFYDLVSMPHLLIGGGTGSGKSIFLHNLILSLLLQYSSKEVNLILIDPKEVECNFDRTAPQVREVVVNAEVACRRIRDLCDEMDNRYKIFSDIGVRDIESYNKKSEIKMTRIVVFIEELADLIIQQGSDIISNITRLVVKARACGIHIILSTQRPEAEFMTGKLRSNFQCSVAFATASQFDSKMIIGVKGAEKLKGNGDGLFRPNDNELIRFQSAFISEEEIINAVKLLNEWEVV